MRIYSESEILAALGEEALNAVKYYVNQDGYCRILEKGTSIRLQFPGLPTLYGEVRKTHLCYMHISYDLDITFENGESTRYYNIEYAYVQEIKFNEIKSS